MFLQQILKEFYALIGDNSSVNERAVNNCSHPIVCWAIHLYNLAAQVRLNRERGSPRKDTPIDENVESRSLIFKAT